MSHFYQSVDLPEPGVPWQKGICYFCGDAYILYHPEEPGGSLSCSEGWVKTCPSCYEAYYVAYHAADELIIQKLRRQNEEQGG